MDTYRLHRRGDHTQCQMDNCPIRLRVETDARHCMYARGVLDYLRDNGIPWENLGTELVKLRKQARYPLEKYKWAVAEFAIDSVVAMECKYLAISIMDAQKNSHSD